MSETGSSRGRPVLGAVSGVLFGVFLAVTLQQFGIRPLDNLSVFGLPLLGLALGLGAALWSPLGRPGTTSETPPAETPPAAEEPVGAAE